MSTETPIETAKPVVASTTRAVKPDKSAYERKLKEIQKGIDTTQARLNGIRSELDSLQAGKGEFATEIAAKKEERATLKKFKDEQIIAKKQLTERINAIKSSSNALAKSQKSALSGFKYTSVDKIEEAIAECQYKQETQSMSLSAEKNLIKEIETLKANRKVIQKLAQEKASVVSTGGSLQDLFTARSAMDEPLNEVSAKITKVNNELTELMGKGNNDEKRALYGKLIDERKTLKAELDEKYNSIRALRSEFKNQNDEYYNQVRAFREKQKEERKLEDEKRQAEYEAKLAEYHKEMEKIHPFQDEMDLCDALVKYLESTYSKELKPTTAAASTESASCCAHKELDGMKPLKRVEEDFFVGKSKKGGKKKNKKKKAALSLPLVQNQSFATIGLLPPTSVDTVSESIAAIKEKKEAFNKQTTRSGDANASETPSEKPASKKVSRQGKYNAQTADFPSLSEATNENESMSNWGPSSVPAPVSAEAQLAN